MKHKRKCQQTFMATKGSDKHFKIILHVVVASIWFSLAGKSIFSHKSKSQTKRKQNENIYTNQGFKKGCKIRKEKKLCRLFIVIKLRTISFIRTPKI
ncbi:hypothetical protein KFK09_027442 [Dendrobium nobile]|uniref:Uncharacterized protein n=1 Tax=Dendrobium nobile TaxID=94219 RepID=A0A8T3A9C3_DENNO|nr:hypothetical protein KFK09_027442 [Dendrobium nobile]